jgi:hypothetical protein
LQCIKNNYKISPNILIKLQNKKLARMGLTETSKVEFDFVKAKDSF